MRDRFATSAEPIPSPFPAAADDGARRFVLLPEPDDGDSRHKSREVGLGAAVAWAGAAERALELIAPIDRAPALARQAESFPRVAVWVRDATSLAPAVPAPLPPIPPLAAAADAHRPLFASVGAVPVDDFGHLVAEVEGLEIGRADGTTGALSIGVGTADRELHRHVNVDTPPEVSLQRAATFVRSIRRPGAPGHPLNRRGRQRWLRSLAHADPSLVGAGSLDLLPPLGPRLLQLGPEPAAARDSGTGTVFVFSVGIDLEAVPIATDYRRRHGADRTVLVTSERDALPAIALMAGTAGIDLMTVPTPF